MASHARRASGSSRWLGCLLLAAALGAHEVFAQDLVASGATSRLRALDENSAHLLQAGNARSATFRLLTQTIERSDLVVYVDTRPLTLPGQLQFVAATPGGRYVRVSVRVPGLDNDLLPWLAHELWHAVEIAGAPDVRDRVSLLRFYERIPGGFRTGGAAKMEVVETVKAQKIRTAVLHELRGF
jgi:hypothetical protein